MIDNPLGSAVVVKARDPTSEDIDRGPHHDFRALLGCVAILFLLFAVFVWFSVVSLVISPTAKSETFAFRRIGGQGMAARSGFSA